VTNVPQTTMALTVLHIVIVSKHATGMDCALILDSAHAILALRVWIAVYARRIITEITANNIAITQLVHKDHATTMANAHV
jgi:hypothetical protein